MYGFRQEFRYLECSKCGCLQILEIPPDLTRFYPPDYYSFSNRVNNSILEKVRLVVKRRIVSYKLNKKCLDGYMFSRFFNSYYWMIKGLCTMNSKILDVGCGNGDLLLELNKLGFKKLKGLDPYIASNLDYNNGVVVLKAEIADLHEKFDLIMLHHSFEHMSNPKTVLQNISNCLNSDGFVLIRIPVASSHAFRKYGVNWVQLDAPRHLFLHTPESLNIIAKEAGFKIIHTMYDSTSFQFSGSENYESEISMVESIEISAKQKKQFKKKAKELNKTFDGDQACFYLQRI
jgi:SAM-dependent methyltransferase